MRKMRAAVVVVAMAALAAGGMWLGSCATQWVREMGRVEADQTPTWSAEDKAFFLHGSLSTECVPEDVLRAMIVTYPELFPSKDLTHLGLIADERFGWPIGISRARPEYLGGMSSIGVNCASCHVAEVRPSSGGETVRVIGVTSHFDAEGFFNSIVGATLLTQKPENMKKFLRAYSGVDGQVVLDEAWGRQERRIAAVMAGDPAGAKEAGEGGFQKLTAADVEWHPGKLEDLAGAAGSMLKLFHNMRVTLHLPDQLPPADKLPPASGPGRNDAFGLLSLELFDSPQPPASVKFGVVWNVEHRKWVHWDGNTRSPIGRNILASIGLGSPLAGRKGRMDFAFVKRHTDLTEKIAAPKYPWAVDQVAAARGATLYAANCLSCHSGEEDDRRLFAAAEVGTDPVRAQLFTQTQADKFNQFLTDFETKGYVPAKEPGLRSTGKYWAANLNGVWARSPYLHNGSVRTMEELLKPASERAMVFHRGSKVFDKTRMGYTDEGAYLLDTRRPGNSKYKGNEYGANLSIEEKRELMEYLKTL